MISIMQTIVKNSLIYRFFAAICRWFSVQWTKSRIIGRFLNMKDAPEVSRSSVFYRVGCLLRRALSAVYEKLRLDKLFTGSIFAKPFVWCFFAAVAAPVMPTMVLVAVVLVSGVAFLVNTAAKSQQSLVCSPINRYVLIYAVIYTIATLTSVTLKESILTGAITVIFILSVFVVENAVTTKKRLDILTVAIVAVGVLVSLYGFYQFIFGTTGSNAWTDDQMFSSIKTRVYSTLQNPNVLSEYLLLIIPLAAAWMFTAKGALKKLVSLCAFGIMCVCMLLTFSRAGWLGLLFAAAIFLILIDRRYIILCVAAVVILFLAAPDVIIDRITSIGDMEDGSTSYRVAIWLGTAAMLKDYWLCGIGPGTAAFNLIYPTYSYNNAIAQHSHNLFLQITSDTGICGIVIFLILLVVFVRMMCTAIHRETDKKSKIFQISFLAGVGGFLVQSMADYSFYNYRVMYLFWVYLGLSALFAARSNLPDGGRRSVACLQPGTKAAEAEKAENTEEAENESAATGGTVADSGTGRGEFGEDGVGMKTEEKENKIQRTTPVSQKEGDA